MWGDGAPLGPRFSIVVGDEVTDAPVILPFFPCATALPDHAVNFDQASVLVLPSPPCLRTNFTSRPSAPSVVASQIEDAELEVATLAFFHMAHTLRRGQDSAVGELQGSVVGSGSPAGLLEDRFGLGPRRPIVRGARHFHDRVVGLPVVFSRAVENQQRPVVKTGQTRNARWRAGPDVTDRRFSTVTATVLPAVRRCLLRHLPEL